jgi:hypothetical protein
MVLASFNVSGTVAVDKSSSMCADELVPMSGQIPRPMTKR